MLIIRSKVMTDCDDAAAAADDDDESARSAQTLRR